MASTCRKNQLDSFSLKQCVLTSATCSPSEVTSSSLRKCIPKAVVTPPKAPRVPVCKYKTDGAGNCLSSHKKRSWAACTKSCGTSVTCKNACENRYAKICGD